MLRRMNMDGGGILTKDIDSKHHLDLLEAQFILSLTSSSSHVGGVERLTQDIAVVKSSLTMINSSRAPCPLTSRCQTSP